MKKLLIAAILTWIVTSAVAADLKCRPLSGVWQGEFLDINNHDCDDEDGECPQAMEAQLSHNKGSDYQFDGLVETGKHYQFAINCDKGLLSSNTLPDFEGELYCELGGCLLLFSTNTTIVLLEKTN